MVAIHWSRLVVPVVALAVAGVAGWALGLRLVDPLASSTIPAEDPYTHLALTREHLRDGSIDAGPYPPGLHVVLATYAAHSGVALAALVRFLPVAFGVLAVVGTALLLRRLDGNAAAVVGAAAVAVTPELVFRSQMFAPTALDIALLPFVLLGLVQTARGQLAWALPTALLLVLLVAAHPWVFGILALTGGAFALLAFVAPWRDGPRLEAKGMAVAALLLGTSTALALSGCWGQCGPGFGVVESADARDADFDGLALAVLGATAGVAALLFFARRPIQAGLDRLGPLGRAGRTIASLVLLAAAVYVGWRARLGGYPQAISPEYMVGWPLIVAALAGLAAVPWAHRPAAHACAALVLATLPFTLFDPFDSPFWPHRTAVYLALGLAGLAGVAAGAAARAIAATAAWSARDRPARWTRAVVPGVVAAIVLGTSLVAAAPPAYPGWYRLHDECESQALQDIAAQADADPRLVVVSASWQSKLVLAATAEDARRVWYLASLATNPAEAERMARFADDTDRPVLLVFDRHAAGATATTPTLVPPADAWRPAGAWPCAQPVTTYLHTPT